MNTLLLEDDVFNYILRQLAATGLSASAFLRSALELAEPRASLPQAPDDNNSILLRLIRGPKLGAYLKAVDRFLVILSALDKEKPDLFEDAANHVTGRSRRYLGKTKQELIQSGANVNPKRIPESSFWVITNNSTSMKRTMLRRLMRAMEYDAEAIRSASAAL